MFIFFTFVSCFILHDGKPRSGFIPDALKSQINLTAASEDAN